MLIWSVRIGNWRPLQLWDKHILPQGTVFSELVRFQRRIHTLNCDDKFHKPWFWDHVYHLSNLHTTHYCYMDLHFKVDWNAYATRKERDGLWVKREGEKLNPFVKKWIYRLSTKSQYFSIQFHRSLDEI